MSVEEACFWENSTWVWDVVGWLKEADDDDAVLRDQLRDPVFGDDERDVCVWEEDEVGGFSVHGYGEAFMKRDSVHGRLAADILYNLHFMWDLKVPSKVSIYVWRLILGRLPTQYNLKARCILVKYLDCYCVFCFLDL